MSRIESVIKIANFAIKLSEVKTDIVVLGSLYFLTNSFYLIITQCIVKDKTEEMFCLTNLFNKNAMT